MKKEETNKLIFALIGVALIIVIVGGATFAYWSWTTSTSQQTQINVVVNGASMTIVGNNVTSTGMYPTADCNGSGALKGDTATVTAVNETASPMQASLKIRATLSKTSLSEANKGKINWAIVEETGVSAAASEKTDGTESTCSTSKIASGTLASVTSNTDIDTGITFIAAANATTVKYYKLYVWLDSSYTFTNTGDNVSDPMQNLTISVKWSPASTLNQQY